MTKAAAVTPESTIVALAVALGATDTPQLSAVERHLAAGRHTYDKSSVSKLRKEILSGHDPIGEMLCGTRSQRDRRLRGTTYTPPVLVASMIDLAAEGGTPSRVIDPASVS